MAVIVSAQVAGIVALHQTKREGEQQSSIALRGAAPLRKASALIIPHCAASHKAPWALDKNTTGPITIAERLLERAKDVDDAWALLARDFEIDETSPNVTDGEGLLEMEEVSGKEGAAGS